MHLVLPIPALVEQRELKQGADVGALGGERDEDGDVGGVVLWVLAVRVEVYRPLAMCFHTLLPFASEYPFITNLCDPFTVSVTDRELVRDASTPPPPPLLLLAVCISINPIRVTRPCTDGV